MTTETQKIELPLAIREHIDRWILRYPPEHKRSGVFEALRVVQEHHGGSLTLALMDAVADYLGMAPISVYEVASFYSLYFLKPVGKHVVDVCTNISCMLNGSEAILDRFKQQLGIECDETTPDGKVTLREVECLGACINAPACQVGKQYHEKLTPEKVDELVRQLTHGK